MLRSRQQIETDLFDAERYLFSAMHEIAVASSCLRRSHKDMYHTYYPLLKQCHDLTRALHDEVYNNNIKLNITYEE